MVNHMNNINYIKINTQNILENIQYIKAYYPYSYYIFDVSNNAFCHGMYLIQYIKEQVDYFYVNHFQDLLLIRKYDQSVPVIYGGEINENNIYDLIMNNAIVVIYDIHTLKMIQGLNIKDLLSFILYIDPKGYLGISNKQDILDFLENSNSYFKLLGIMAKLEEKDYDDFKYIIRPISNLKLMILNSEDDKRKIQGSNAIKLDYSIYGMHPVKKKLFQKKEPVFKQAFSLYSEIINIKEITHNKKTKFIAVVPFGYHHGMSDVIKYVYIQKQLYPIINVTDEFVHVEVDENIHKGMKVEITSENNPLENYFPAQTLNYFTLFYTNIPIAFDDYILEKTLIY